MEIEMYNEKMFEKIKYIDEYRNEYWEVRELMYLLEYSKWENFHKVINKATITKQKTCKLYTLQQWKSDKKYNKRIEKRRTKKT